MARAPDIDPAMAIGLLGLQDSTGLAGSVALLLAMQRRHGVATPEQAARTASRYRLPEDLLPLVPREPGFLAGRRRRDGFRSAIIGLKRLDALPSEERTAAIEQVEALLGTVGPQVTP